MNNHLQWVSADYDPRSVVSLAVVVAVCCLVMGGCAFPGSVSPTVKIGLSAPFEGLHRDLGYEVLHAVRLAVRQRNADGGVDGTYMVELVALNDHNQPVEAQLQAREMAADPGILGVIGGWSPDCARSAAAEYRRLGLAFLAPEADSITALAAGPDDESFVGAYLELSGGALPGAPAVWAYAAANRLLDALDAAADTKGKPTRAAVRAALIADS